MTPASIAEKIGFPEETGREMAHKALDVWFDQLVPLYRQSEPPTLEELSRLFQDTRLVLLGGVMHAMIGQFYAPYLTQEVASCPTCATQLKRRRLDKKEVSTMQGRFHLERPYFYCVGCDHGFHPLDEVLGLARERHQYGIQANVTRLAADLPFKRSAEHFRRLTGIGIGNHFSHEVLSAVGDQASLDVVIPTKQEIKQRIMEVRGSAKRRPVLVVASDGAHTPIRQPGKRNEKRGAGAYQEAKGVRIYLVGAQERIVQIASWHQVQNAEAFTRDLQSIAERIPQEQVRIGLLGDGSDWLWNAMRSCFPKAREVLDYFHCSEHLHTTAFAQYGETLEARQWVEATVSRLFLGNATQVLGGLRRMNPVDDKAEEAIANLIGYLGKRLDQINYGSARRAGVPIGSGGIESANKFICHTRLKLSGAWWLRENSNAMLRIRCAVYNGTFDQVFDDYKQSRLKII